MEKEDRIIMVVGRERLFNASLENSPQRFLSPDKYDFVPKINFYYEWKRRGDVENDPNYKQPIAYSVILNPSLKKVFAYKRSSDVLNYSESRLAGNWCWGVGGHVEKEDVRGLEWAYDVILRSRDRELSEEVFMDSYNKISLLGYINDDSNDVGRVHLGILYVVETNSDKIIPRDKEIAEGSYKDLSELEEICKQAKITGSGVKVDNWSEIALNPLRNFLMS